MIEFKNITLHRKNKPILKECNFKVEQGEKIVITGDSGTGKTTILNLIVGLADADKGEILFNGNPVHAGNISKIRSQIAYIGQEPALAASTVKEALLFPFSFKANLKHIPDQKKINDILDFLLLDKDIQEKSAVHISGGEKQRIAIARAMLLDKKIFLADEITSALDKKVIKQLHFLFDNDTYTLISVSHDTEWINSCSRVMHLENGCLQEKRND